MAYTIGQILAASYNAVLADKKKAHNQWEESAFMHEWEKQGGIEHKSLGVQIDIPLDVNRNPGTTFLTTDLQSVSTAKTEILTSAVYDIAELTVPIVWSKKDEVQNPSENQKVDLVDQLLTNGFASHSDYLEQYTFQTSTNGYLGLLTHITDAGTGSDGGIDSSTNTMWRNQQATYVDDTDIEATFTTVWNACAKGSGSKLMPTLMVSDGATQALFEGTQQANQRYVDSTELKAGFKILAFKTARYVFSQYASTRVFFLNSKNFKLVVSKQFYMDRSETQEFPQNNGYITKIYSALQTVTNNRSRLGVAHV